MIKRIKDEVADLQKMAIELSLIMYDDPTRKIAEDTFWYLVDALDKRAVGLVGRHVKFQVADGYAHYIIVKGGKTFVSVEQLPIHDNWHFDGVYDGKIQRGIVERQLNFQDGMKALFSKSKIGI